MGLAFSPQAPVPVPGVFYARSPRLEDGVSPRSSVRHAGSELAEVSAAIELLMIAAETGEPDDTAAATDEVEIALRTTHSRRQLRTGS